MQIYFIFVLKQHHPSKLVHRKTNLYKNVFPRKSGRLTLMLTVVGFRVEVV